MVFRPLLDEQPLPRHTPTFLFRFYQYRRFNVWQALVGAVHSFNFGHQSMSLIGATEQHRKETGKQRKRQEP